jgi:hypothetical protein
VSWLVKLIVDILVNSWSCIGSSVITIRTLSPDGKNSTTIVFSWDFTLGRKSITSVIASRSYGPISVNLPRVSCEMANTTFGREPVAVGNVLSLMCVAPLSAVEDTAEPYARERRERQRYRVPVGTQIGHGDCGDRASRACDEPEDS